MNSRERVLAAVQGQEVFPVPVDLFENGLYPSGAAALRKKLNLPGDDFFEDILRALGADFRWATAPYAGPPLSTEGAPQGITVDYPNRRIERNIWGTWDGVDTFTGTLERPLADAETVAEIDAYPWPSPDVFDFSRVYWINDPDGYSEPVEQWSARHADYARIIGCWNPAFSRIMDLCGFERGLMNIASRPDLIEAMMAHISEFYVEFYTRLARAARGRAEFLGFGDDFGQQDGMILSPAKWRRYFLPVWKRLFAIAHENSLKPLMHMCGSIRPILGDLVDAGLVIYQVAQFTARNMDMVELKREFGNHLTFYGGVDTQRVMPLGTPEEVRREVRKRIDVMARGGRFVVSSMHYLMDDVPTDNIVAMYDEARSYRPPWA
jgi:uroporphyrinogen decarboxylase